MRTPRRLLSWTIALAACLPSTTAAQTEPYLFLPLLRKTEAAEGLHLRIDLLSGFHWTTTMWGATPTGVDLYRRTIGFQCGAYERINPEPLPWMWRPAGPFESAMVIEFVDTTSQHGTACEYMVRSVPEVSENPDFVAGHATRGEALIGHGDILRTALCGPLYFSQRARTCEQECFPAAQLMWPEEAEPYVNTGQPLVLYGRIDGGGLNTCADAYVTWGNVTRVERRTCLLAVESATWSAAKSLYR